MGMRNRVSTHLHPRISDGPQIIPSHRFEFERGRTGCESNRLGNVSRLSIVTDEIRTSEDGGWDTEPTEHRKRLARAPVGVVECHVKESLVASQNVAHGGRTVAST